ncbi:MAG: SIS domain-containing protein [Candidatus Schekmanbacteria bacterium]|nr:SIS domain-containing protein [Candidatus Schekmanbacteria bacterium]
MREIAKEYYDELIDLLGSIEVTGRTDGKFDLYRGVEAAGLLICKQNAQGRKVIFVGNGASAAMSSHASTDFWKNGGLKAIAFNDSSLLTCISNDYGYQHVFEKPVEMFAEPGDVLFAISSSGNSENIVRAVQAAKAKDCKILTLTGFKPDNRLRCLGDLNFYVAAKDYGPVEIIHHSICHCILDTIIKAKNGQVSD